MLKSIQAELYKLFKNRTFKVLIFVTVLLSSMTIVMCSSVFEQILSDSLENLPEDQKQIFMEQMTSISESDEIVTPGQLGVHLEAKDIMNPPLHRFINGETTFWLHGQKVRTAMHSIV